MGNYCQENQNLGRDIEKVDLSVDKLLQAKSL